MKIAEDTRAEINELAEQMLVLAVREYEDQFDDQRLKTISTIKKVLQFQVNPDTIATIAANIIGDIDNDKLFWETEGFEGQRLDKENLERNATNLAKLAGEIVELWEAMYNMKNEGE